MIGVLATREGLIGGRTASGYIIDTVVPFVALPSVHALHHFIRITNPANGKQTKAVVLDVGPWNEYDDSYVFNNERPLAELGRDTRGIVTNKAGIDLSERVWNELGMADNGIVQWEFLE